MNDRHPKILLDIGDSVETRHIKNLLGFLDGQTTNPSRIAKSPRIKEPVASGNIYSVREELAEYLKIVQTIGPLSEERR